MVAVTATDITPTPANVAPPARVRTLDVSASDMAPEVQVDWMDGLGETKAIVDGSGIMD
jgi:hypothetical protein